MGVVSEVSRRVLPFGVPLKASFPPEHLLDPTPTGDLEKLTVAELEARTRRLEKLEGLYHKGQEQAWDGRAVLAELVERHGGVNLPAEKRDAIGRIFTIILWGELAAWEVASHLAENLRDHTEVKMAATIQTFDEARHYYVMRDYLRLLGMERLPELNGFVKSMLCQMIATSSPLQKIVGMQLFVEHVAVHLFRTLSEERVEPVLADLLPYFHRDEARHVALGKVFLPELLAKLTRREAVEIQLYQLWLMAFMQLSIEYHRHDAETLGIDIQRTLRRAMRDQTEMLDTIQSHPRVRGLVVLPKNLRFVSRWVIETVWADPDAAAPQGATARRVGAALSSPAARRARDAFTRGAERAWRSVA